MYNLLVESSDKVEMLTENTESGKQVFIEGIFAQSEIKNGNGRFYERSVMEKAIDRYDRDYVSRRRALGELNHPEYPFADPSQAAILIKELEWQGNDVYGKALVLNTPKGEIVKGLLEGGFNLGVSTRALGSLKERNGTKYVQDDLMFTATDCVDNPSAPDAYVNAINESKQWMLTESGIWVQKEGQEPVHQFDEGIFLQKLEDYVKGLKK